jgi:hypothetical protein
MVFDDIHIKGQLSLRFLYYKFCVNDCSDILFGFFCQKDLAKSVLKRPKSYFLLDFSHAADCLPLKYLIAPAIAA